MCVCINMCKGIYMYRKVLNATFPCATVLSASSRRVSPFTLGLPPFIFLSHAFLQHDVFHSCPSSAGGGRLIA